MGIGAIAEDFRTNMYGINNNNDANRKPEQENLFANGAAEAAGTVASNGFMAIA